MSAPAPHVLILTIDPDGEDDWDSTIECPGIADGQCMTYWGCQVEDCDPDDDGEAHGVEHTSMHFGWAVESDDCWVQNYDEIRDSITQMFADAHRPMATGRYLVWHETDDEWMNLHFEAPSGATS